MTTQLIASIRRAIVDASQMFTQCANQLTAKPEFDLEETRRLCLHWSNHLIVLKREIDRATSGASPIESVGSAPPAKEVNPVTSKLSRPTLQLVELQIAMISHITDLKVVSGLLAAGSKTAALAKLEGSLVELERIAFKQVRDRKIEARRAELGGASESDSDETLPVCMVALSLDELGAMIGAGDMVLMSTAGEGPYLDGLRSLLARLKPLASVLGGHQP